MEMDPQVWSTDAAYADYGDTAREALLLGGHPIPLPEQGLNGDCWLLVAALGLQQCFPRILQDTIVLDDVGADIFFPSCRLRLNYVFPRLPGRDIVFMKTALHIYWALLEKAYCLYLFQRQRTATLAQRKGTSASPGIWDALACYSDLRRRRVSEALTVLTPRGSHVHPPKRLLTCARLSRLIKHAVVCAEVERDDSLHSLLVVESSATRCLAYDPWGQFLVLRPGQHLLLCFSID